MGKSQLRNIVDRIVKMVESTGRKQTKEELRMFRTISDQANSGASISSLDGTFIYVNDTLARMVGWEARDLLGKNYMSIHNEEQAPRVSELIKLLKTKGGLTSEELFHTRKDGSTFPSLMTAKVIYDEKMGAQYMSASIIDITEKKLSEEKIKQQNERLNAIVSAMPDLIFVIDEEGTYTEFYFSTPEILPVLPDQIIGTNLKSFFSKEIAGCYLESIHECIQFKKLTTFEYQVLEGNSQKYYEARLAPYGNAQILSFVRDVTEMKEKDLVVKKLSLAIQQSPVGIAITDLNANLEYVNPAFEANTGYSFEEVKGQNPRILQSGKMDPAVYKDLWETISAGKKWRGEWMNKKKNGELYWEDVSITPIFGEKEKVTNYLAVKQDITQRKTSDQQILDLNVNLERKIAERENQYRSVVENVNEVIFQTDAQGLWLFLNKSWETVTGFSVDESLGQLFLNYVHPNDRQHNMELFEPLINREKEYCRHQIRYLTKDGGFRWIEVFARLGLNEKDEITGTYGTLQDITDTKRAVDELEESRERYRGLSEAAFDSIFFSEKGICIEQNQMARKVFGYTDEEAIGRYGTDWIVPADRPIVMKNMLSGMEEPYEVTALKKDGTTFPCMLCGKMMYYKGRDVRVTSLIDITERKLAEESIREARDAAEKANHAKSEFLSRMSHELRTPMNSILGFAQLMNMSGLSPAHRKSVNHIWNSGKHLLTLINEVLDISRIEAGKFAMSIEPVQIHGAISEMLEVVQPEAVKRNITTQMLHSPANELFVLADRQRFKQVLLNLIINAVKYNRDGGSVKIKCELIEKETHGISSVRVLIIDTGIGIKPENMEKLFLPFERIGAEKTITEGTGLGLTMVKMMMKGMGGTIGVESIYGEGSTFWVELPLAADKKIQKKISSDTLEKDTAENEQSGTILYIEDNILNIELVDEIINSHRPAIHLITSIFGSNAIKSATEYKPDLILLDLDLPDIKGTQVLANLQANDQTRSIPVVIVSADAMSDKIKQLMNAGARDYLTKPLDINLFLQVVDKWIGDKDKDTGLIKPPKE